MVEAYLKRIGYRKKPLVGEETLCELHRHHVFNVPFEDLDIHYKTPIQLSLEAVFQKVVIENRGGFCYELNYLFEYLLRQLGFDTRIISASIYNEEGTVGPEFDHIAIIVDLQDQWLLDVGYGDLFIEPLKIKDHYTRKDWFKTYKLEKTKRHDYLLLESEDDNKFTPRYLFGTQARAIEDFYDQCQFKQFHEDSYFVKNKICTLPTENGRISIFNDHFIERNNSIRKEFPISSEEELQKILRARFNIHISAGERFY